jgi:hypothetical protein
MFVVRPKGIRGTPHSLAMALGGQTRFYPNPKHSRPFSYRRDFFMTPVAPQHVTDAPAGYGTLYNFLTRNKYGQRKTLESHGIPVPRLAADAEAARTLTGTEFVVRPLRHSRGVGYRVTNDRLDFAPGTEYISELYAKRREYRVIFVFGNPLIWLRKKPGEGVDYTQPWGHHNGSFFQTINDIPRCKLSGNGIDVVPRLVACPVVRAAHIVAADILYSSKAEHQAVVLELNACPSLYIEANQAKVVEAIRART